jgi:hypothetical protein
LELFGVKLAEASKKFGKKFACGASVTKDASNKEQIDVQARGVVPAAKRFGLCARTAHRATSWTR